MAGTGTPSILDAEDRRRRRAEWKVILAVTGVGAGFGFAFGWNSSLDPGDPIDLWVSGLQGIITAVLFLIPLLWLEVAGSRLPWMARLRARPLWAYFLVKIVMYVAVAMITIEVTRLVFNVFNPQSLALDRAFFEGVVAATMLSLVANAVIEVGRLIGFRELGRILAGRYLRPRLERRVFLTIDLKASTAAAARLGDLRFHELLKRFFDDVADAAHDHGAELHKFVGDEAILTWSEESALRGARCVLCPFGLALRIDRAADEYRDRFGFVPSFRAALHVGAIVAGEVGGMKREIAFVGDTLNTTARLADVARSTEEDVVASGELADCLQLPAGVVVVSLGDQRLRGKEVPVSVVALRLD